MASLQAKDRAHQRLLRRRREVGQYSAHVCHAVGGASGTLPMLGGTVNIDRLAYLGGSVKDAIDTGQHGGSRRLA
ncbi:hypothetical protein GCM10009608_80670 [Pseudonocardia alaniniphila]